MRGIIATTAEEAGLLLQFGVLKVGKVYRSVSAVHKGFIGALLEVDTDTIKQHLLHKEDCHTISVPIHVEDSIVVYGPIYATTKSVILRAEVIL